jgi:predicted ATPase
MLHRLEISNFYAVREPQVVDLRVSGHSPPDPERTAPRWAGAPDRAPKVVALFGANASGKSTILKSLSFLAWFVRESFRAAPESWMPYQRFNDEESGGLPTRLAVQFSGPADLQRVTDPQVEQCRYAYEVTLGGPRDQPPHVLSEVLKYWPPHAGRQVRLFDRDEKGAVSAGKEFGLSGFRQALEKVLRPNASVVSTLTQLKHPLATFLWQTAGLIQSNILIEKQEVNDDAIARYYAANPEQLELLNKDIQRIDLGVRSIRVEPGTNGPLAWFEHQGLATALPVHLESHGTRQFIRIFPLLNLALQTGGVAVVDELDLAIHPLVLPEILRWFHDSERNPHDAQLWMTCNNASLLEDLAKEEVLFCEKDDLGRTSVYGLRDVQAVRRGDNYYRKYLGGVYGAVPHLG